MSRTKSILLADNDLLFRTTYRDLFSKPCVLGSRRWPGYRVHIATTHEQLWALLESEHPSLVILDITLAGGDSREFMRRLRTDAALRNTPVIMTYPVAETDLHQEFEDMKLGIDFRLIKPLDPQQLLGIVIRIESAEEEMHT